MGKPADSSDDDFRLSDKGSHSPNISRLKRQKRRSTRDQPTGLTPHESSFQDDKADVISIPDSLDQEDDKFVPDSGDNSIGDPVPPDNAVSSPMNDNDRSVENAADSLREVDENSNDISAAASLEADRYLLGDDFEDNEKQVPKPGAPAEQDDTLDQSDTDAPKTKRPATKSARYGSSESDDDARDDAYSSAEDSPEDDDAESDFEPSPKKPTRKRMPAKTPPSRPAPTSRARTPTSAKQSGVSTPLGRRASATKRASPSSGGASAGPSVSPASLGKRRLGAKMPMRSTGLGPPNAASAQGTRTGARGEANAASSTVFRSGLSRKVSIPRLHAYLPRK